MFNIILNVCSPKTFLGVGLHVENCVLAECDAVLVNLRGSKLQAMYL